MTLAEMQAALAAEGYKVTRDIVSRAVAGDRPKKFRAWFCYEPRHVDAVREMARKLLPKRIVRVKGPAGKAREIDRSHQGAAR